MITVQSASGTSLTIDESQTQTLESSIVKVVNTLTGAHKRVKDANEMVISEDILCAAVTYNEMKQQNEAAAASFIQSLYAEFSARAAKDDPQAILGATRTLVDRAVTKKQISKQAGKQILATASAKAQIDSKTLLSKTLQKGGIEKFAESAERRSPAKASTTPQVVTQTESVTHRKNAGATVKTQLKKVVASMKRVPHDAIAKAEPVPATPTKSTSSAPTSSTKDESVAPTKETDKKAPVPDPALLPTGPNDLVYKPESDKNENALVILPRKYSDDVEGVSIYSGDTLHEKLKHTGLGADGRRYFRGSKKGKEYPKDSYLRLNFIDGSYLEVKIGSPAEYYVRHYTN